MGRRSLWSIVCELWELLLIELENRALGALIRSIQGVRGGYSKAGVVAAYYANVRFIFEYGSVIWAGAVTSNLRQT